MERQAMYAFSADPIHYGHTDVIERAAKMFDQVIVGIGDNPLKKYLFSLEERLAMAQRTVENIANVQVISFKGLLVDYAAENGIGAVIKGIRTEADVDYELMLHHVGQSQKVGVDTFFVPARQDLTHVSSSAVKALQKEQGLVNEYVPLHVKQALEERISNQYIIGLTGEMGTGKSYVGKKFLELAKAQGIPAHNIELDTIGHEILGNSPQELYKATRETIIQTFAPFTQKIRAPDGSIDRKALGEVVFNDPSKLQKLNEIMHKPLRIKLRRELYGKTGLIFVNAALLAEAQLLYVSNNNTVLVYADEATQQKRLQSRGLSIEQIQRRKEGQYTTQQKMITINKVIEESAHGFLLSVNNSEGTDQIKEYFQQVLDSINYKENKA